MVDTALMLVRVAQAAMGSQVAIRSLAAIDAQHDLEKCPTEAAREKRLAESFTTVERRVRIFRRRLFGPLFLLLTSIAVAWISQHVAVLWFSADQLAVGSALVFAWAGMSRLGWHEGSFSGRTTVEQADKLIFHTLCAVGMYLAALVVM